MWVSRPRFRGEPITALCENCIEINSLYVYRHITATTPPHSSLDNIGFSFSLILSLPTPTRSPIHITTDGNVFVCWEKEMKKRKKRNVAVFVRSSTRKKSGTKDRDSRRVYPPPLIVVHRTGFAAAHNLHLYLSPPPTDGTGIITLRLFEFNGHYACSLLKCTLCAFRPPLWPAPAKLATPLSNTTAAAKKPATERR
ncbi:Uncharacterized protein FWK35_00035679 [Aphis craccivora]|uniref:Uncharacterized protein n=1 Tax=Aphis craccivora TaxID=307492 RepID=A0A6G0YXK3_APHCR|nr:Uncharacterized protein FWK35_00035679 [Aphis craccivora]